MKKWIEKQLDAERRKSILIFSTISFFLGAMALMLIYLALMPYLDGVYTLDTKEKMDRYSQKNYWDGLLFYQSAHDLQSSVIITSDNGNILTVNMNGAYAEVPIGETKTETEYHVWRLMGDGYMILYLTEGAFEDVGSVHVQTQYRELNDQIIDQFAPNEQNVYVLYDEGSPIPFFTILAICIVVSVVLFLLRRPRFLRKRTILGRQLAALGDYDEITKEINRQAMNPLFTCNGCTILHDWILFRNYNDISSVNPYFTTIDPVDDVMDMEIALEEDEEDDEAYTCKFHVKGYQQPFVIYLDVEQVAVLKDLKRIILRNQSII